MTDKKRNTSRSQVTELNTSDKKVQPEKSVKNPASEVRRESVKRTPVKQEVKATPRRDTKGSTDLSIWAKIMKWRFVRFLKEAYYELRHKVTWPTFQEARNMTIAVIVISVVIGGILSLLDLGLFQLFIFITSRK
jgi:preprotein translocase SecE subunit